MSNGFAVQRSRLVPRLDVRRLLFLIPLVSAVILLADRPHVLLALLATTVFVLALAFLREWLALVLYALIAFSVEIDFAGGVHAITLPTEALIPILFLTVTLTILVTGRFRYVRSPLNGMVALYLVVMYASLLITREPVSTVKALLRDSGYIFAGYILLQIFLTSRRRLAILLGTCAFVHLLLVVYGFATQAVGGIRIYDEIAYPFFENHCIYAAYLSITLAFLIAFGLGCLRGIWATMANGMALVIGVAVALTFVRAAWISVAFMLVYFLFHFRRRPASVNLLLTFLIVDLLAVVIVLTTDLGRLVVQRMETIADLGYVANYDRLDRWLAALHMWRDQPIYGMGYGVYPDLYAQYIVYESAYSTHLRMGAHNLYFEILAETGVIGLSVFLLMLFVFFRQAITHDPGDRDRLVSCALAGTKAAMITFLVHAFLNNLGPSDKIGVSFWVLLGMVPCSARLAEQSLGEAWNRRVARRHRVLVPEPAPAPASSTHSRPLAE